MREILEERFLNHTCTVPLTRAQFCLLKLITLNPELQLGEVARGIGVSPAASSKNVDKLEQAGLVTREVSPDDRRATVLRASEKGKKLVCDFERLKAERLAPVIETLGEEKSRMLCEILEEVCSGLLEREQSLRKTCLRCAGYVRADCTAGRLLDTCALRPRRPDGPAGDRAGRVQ